MHADPPNPPPPPIASDARRAAITRVGVVLVLCAEAMFFAGLLGAVLVLRSAEPAAFELGAQLLSRRLAAAAGACLLGGSASALLLAQGRSRRFGTAILMLLLCAGAAGCALAVLGQLRDANLERAGTNFVAAYGLAAGALAVHEIVGIGIALRLLGRSRASGPALANAMRPWELYWHFATAVGVVLYLMLYRGR